MDEQLLIALQPLFNRPAPSHKYDFGHVLVVGGAPGMVGAPLLTAQAALRIGAGLVTIASTDNVIDKLEKRVKEIMTLRISNDVPKALAALHEFIAARKVSVLAIGPGLDPSMAALAKTLVHTVRLPIVLDAGGLSAYNDKLAALRPAGRQNPDIILTPHQGEFTRLVGQELPAGSAAIHHLVTETAQTTNTTIILKGHYSFVTATSGKTYVNHSGNPGLATAGTGDVLTGVIAGLLAQHLNRFDAACGGVYLHGLAGDLAATVKTEAGMIASDVVEFIPAALTQTKTKKPSNKA